MFVGELLFPFGDEFKSYCFLIMLRNGLRHLILMTFITYLNLLLS